jgi:hypothetical protein
MHRHYCHYSEGDRVVQVVEPCRDTRTGMYYEIVAEDSVSQWQPPFENEPLASERVEQIRRRFFDAGFHGD